MIDNDLRTPRVRDNSGAMVAGVIITAVILIGGIFLLMPHSNKGDRLIGKLDNGGTVIEQPAQPAAPKVEEPATTKTTE